MSPSVVPDVYAQWPLGAMWLAYFALHSLLASHFAKARLAARWPSAALRYRLAYNIIAVVTLLPLGAWVLFRPGPMIWSWHGLGAWIANGLALLALVGAQRVARHYDMASFLGLGGKSAEIKGSLRLSPWHRHVRHPWYCLALIIIWTRDMNAAMLVSALCLSAYFVVGSRWEEEKLIAEFGDVYRAYRRRVPGLIPWPGKSLSAAEAERLVGKRSE